MARIIKGQARLRLVVDNERESDGGYMSGRSSCLETPDAASTDRTRSAGTRPVRRHFWTAWYRTPHFSANGCNPPPPSIARSTTLMGATLQLPVAIRQQPQVVSLFPNMQLMVAAGKTERERFQEALNARVAREHKEERGRAVWLYDHLVKYGKTHRNAPSFSKALCGYYITGKKIPTGDRVGALCDALGMSRGELFGEAHDPRLAAIIRKWAELPERMKNGMFSMVPSDDEGEPEAKQAESAVPIRKTR